MSGSARTDDLKRKFQENPGRHFAALANEYRRTGNLDKAIELCREYLREQPRHLSGNVVLAKALFARGDREGARGAFEAALVADPDNLDALYQLALLARDEGQGVLALDYARRALAVDPQDPELLAMAADLSAPPDEDVAPPSFDPRAIFDDSATQEPVQPQATTNPLSQSRAVDELLRDLPVDSEPPAAATSETQSASSEFETQSPPATPETQSEVAASDAEPAFAAIDPEPAISDPESAIAAEPVAAEPTSVKPDVGVGDDEASSSEAALASEASVDIGSQAPVGDVSEAWDGPPPDDLEIPDDMISDWPATSSAASDESGSDASSSVEDASEEVASDEAGPEVAAEVDFERFEYTPPDRSPKTTPHGDALLPVQEESAESSDAEVAVGAGESVDGPPAEAPEQEAGPESPEVESEPATLEAAADVEQEAAPAPEPPDASIVSSDEAESGEPESAIAQDVQLEPAADSAPPEQEPADPAASGHVDWPDLDWPADVGSIDPAATAATDPAPAAVDARPPAASPPHVATETVASQPNFTPVDPPLTRLPEEAEVPPEERVAFATETMAELLVSQGRREDAARLYQQIIERQPEDPGVRQRMESVMSTRDASVRSAEGGALPMRELLSRILAYTPPGAETITPPVSHEAQEFHSTDDTRAAARSTIAGMMAESEQDAERAARTFADAASALGDPTAEGRIAAAVDSQPEPISAVLARVASESADASSGTGSTTRITPRQAPTFSFDQFFRDAMPEEESPSVPDEHADGVASPPPEDDEDGFRAWLDGLRKS